MPKYELDALRAIRVIQRTHEKAGHSVQADQMRQIGDQVEAMQAELYDWQERANEHANNSAAATTELIGLRAELAALKEAARPIAKWWRAGGIKGVVKGTNKPISAEQLDALAALVGEG